MGAYGDAIQQRVDEFKKYLLRIQAWKKDSEQRRFDREMLNQQHFSRPDHSITGARNGDHLLLGNLTQADNDITQQSGLFPRALGQSIPPWGEPPDLFQFDYSMHNPEAKQSGEPLPLPQDQRLTPLIQNSRLPDYSDEFYQMFKPDSEHPDRHINLDGSGGPKFNAAWFNPPPIVDFFRRDF